MYVGSKPEAWVNVDQAKDYKSTALAVQAAIQIRPQADLEVILSFDDPRYDIALPLHAEPPHPPNTPYL